MAGKLTKDTKTTYTPGSPGTPGTPGSPARPAYTTVETVTVPAQYWIELPPTATLEELLKELKKAKYKTSTRTVTTYHPAVPAVPPTPGTPGTPAQITHDFNIGWNAGAISDAVLSSDCDFVLSVSPSSVGIVAGLNSSNEGAGYKEIDHGLYFSHNRAIVYELGSAKTYAFAFVAADSFTIRRSGAVVTYLQNDELLYTSSIASAGPVFADASLYMGGDTILAASFVGVGTQPDESATTSGGGGAASFSRLSGAASNKAVASSQGEFLPLTGAADSGELAPAYAVSSASFAYLLGAAHGLTGEVGASAGSFAPMGGVSANRSYASAIGVLEPLATFSTFIIPPAAGAHGGAALTLPALKLTASGHDSAGENAFAGILPALALSAFGGTSARLTLPALAFDADATSTNWGQAALSLPALRLDATGTTGGVASAELVIPDTWQLAGYSGAVCAVTVGNFTVQASGTTGAVGNARLALPLFEMAASGTAQNYGSAALLLPALQMGGVAQAWMVLPGFTLSAIGTAVVAATYEAYSINLSHAPGNPAPVDEVTRYTNFPFTHIVRYQGSYFGVAGDGLYLLEGTTDDGVAIHYALKTGTDDFDVPQLKTVAAAYFGGRLGPSATVTLHAGETGAESYSYTTPRGQAAQSHREKFGRGVKNRYFALGLAGEDALALDSIELEINKSTRRI